MRRVLPWALLVVALNLLSAVAARADAPMYKVSCCADWGYEVERGYVQPNGEWSFREGARGANGMSGDYWICDTSGDDSIVQAEILVAFQRTDGKWAYAGTPLRSAGADAADGASQCALYELPAAVASLPDDAAMGYVKITVVAPGKATAVHRFAPPSAEPLPPGDDPSFPPGPDPTPVPPGPPPERPSACDPTVRGSSLRMSASARRSPAGEGGAVVTTAYGGRVRLQGRLTHRDGTPAPGARVCVAQRVATGGAPRRALATLVTDAHGRFAYTAPAGPSRRLWFVYRVPGAAAATHVDVRVRAGVTLRGMRRALRNGQTLVMRGRLKSPRRGVLVELQARRGTRWQTFATTRSGRRGQFSYGYRFTRTTGVQRYALRARVAAQPGYPFATGASRPIVVRVTG